MLHPAPAGSRVHVAGQTLTSHRGSCAVSSGACSALKRREGIGEVAKRSNAADCKSVALAASKVRILPSPPAFARMDRERGYGWQASRHEYEGPKTAGLPAGDASDEQRRRACPPERERSERIGGSNSVVESQPSKLLVAGSIPVSRSSYLRGAGAPRTPPRRRSLGLGASHPAPPGRSLSLAPTLKWSAEQAPSV